MTVQQKLEEAEYFLKKIHEYQKPDEIKELYYNFSAYLSSVYSIWDYSLNEANRLYNLGLDDSDTWYYSNFEQKAKNKKSEDIRPFEYYRWFSKRKREVDRTKIGRAFSKARQINIHKKPVFEIRYRILELPKFKALPKEGKMYHSRGTLKIEWILLVMGLGEMNFMTACDDYLQTMKQFVTDSRNKIDKLNNKK